MSRGASIGRVFATEAMEVRIPMTDVQISELGLSLGYSARSSGSQGIPAKVSTVFGEETRHWQGYVKSVDANIDNQTRLLFATVVVDQPFAHVNENNQAQAIPLVPGLFVDVELASPQKVIGLELPRTALRNGNQVYVYNNDALNLKPVKVIYTSQEKVIVAQQTSAIGVGDKIITSSVPGAYEGMPIKLVAAEANEIAEQGQSQATDANTQDQAADSEAVAQPDAEDADEDSINDSDTSVSISLQAAELAASNG